MTISIIIPTHNCSAYLEEAVRSVMNQTYKDIEIIVIDDGSTDRTEEILINLKKEDKRIFVFRNKIAKGVAASRNKGIKCSLGEYIAFLDCDDVYHKEKLKYQVEVFADYPEIDMVFGNVARFTDDINKVTGYYLNGRDFICSASSFIVPVSSYLYLCNENFYSYMSVEQTSISTMAVIVKRNRLDELDEYFLEDMTIGEDIDLWFRLARISQVAYLDKTLAYYRSRPGSLTSNFSSTIKGFINVHSKNLLRGIDDFNRYEIKKYKERIAYNWKDLGYYYFSQLKTRDARRSFWESLNLKFRWHVVFLYLKSCIPVFILRRMLSIWRIIRH